MKSTLALAAAASLGLAGAALAEDLTVPSGAYDNDPTHTYIYFQYSHLGFSNPIVSFQDFDIDLTFDAENPEASALAVEIDPASVDTNVEKFDEHLKSGDFFDVATHKEITFTAKELKKTGDATGTMTGDLTIKGITKPVTLDVTLNQAGQHPIKKVDALGFSASGEIKRSDWDLGAYAPAVSDEVKLIIEAEFTKAE